VDVFAGCATEKMQMYDVDKNVMCRSHGKKELEEYNSDVSDI
jgi:hypothetical protein